LVKLCTFPSTKMPRLPTKIHWPNRQSIPVGSLGILDDGNVQWKKGRKRSRILQAYESKNVLHTWRWPCRPKHLEKDSENQHNKAARIRKHNLQTRLFFSLPNPSSRATALGSTQPLTEISSRNLPGGKGRPARKSDNLAANCLENSGTSTPHNPMGLKAS
jgi:hypothetical protein